MQERKTLRARILKRLTMVLAGLTLVSVMAQPADAARWRGRGWARGWGGYRAYRMPYGGFSRPYRGYGYGYRPAYGLGYGYGPTFYSRGYSGGALPAYRYGLGYGGYSPGMMPGAGYYNYGMPIF